MKKIFYFLLLMISGFVWGQINQFNNLCSNNTNLTFTGDFNTKKFRTPSNSSCNKDDSDIYKSINYYKVTSGGSFEFDYDFTSGSPVNFHVWVLSESEIQDFFSDTATKNASIRHSYSSTGSRRGLFKEATDECEYYDEKNDHADGKLKPINVTAGQYIVIGFVTRDANAKINNVIRGGTAQVCEPEPGGGVIPDFNNLCFGEQATYKQVVDAVKTNSNLSDIKLYTDNTFSNLIDDPSTIFNTNTILYAQVRDDAGSLKFIYTIPIVFKSIIYYNLIEAKEEFCSSDKTFSKEQLIYKVSPTIASDKYSDYEVYLNNVKVEAPIVLQNETIYSVKLSYIGTEFCPITPFSESVNFELKNSNPTLETGKSAEVCNSETLSEADILLALGVDATSYKLVNMPATPYDFEGNEAKFKVQIVDKVNENCKSNIVDFKVIRKPNIVLNSLPNFEKCRSEFSFFDFRDKIDEVKNFDSNINLTINYNGINYTETQLQSLYDLILGTTDKTNFNLLITGNQIGFCELTVPLTIILNKSSVPRKSFDVLLSPGCLGVTQDYTFSVVEIKEHIKGYLGFTNISDFEILNSDATSFQPVNVLANSNKTLIFKIRNKSETCLSEEMYLIVETVNKPNVNDKTYSTKFCEGEILTINDDLLKNYFGPNVFDYKIFIEGVEYIEGNPIQKRLNTFLNISIEFKNRLSESCSTIVNLTINKKPDLIVDIAALESYTKDNPIIYCEENNHDAKNEINRVIDYIKNYYRIQYPNLDAKSSDGEILAQFNSDKGEVIVDFEDPNFCGIASIKFFYQKNTLPAFDIPTSAEVCTDTKYILDFEELAKEKGLNVDDYNFVVNGIDKNQISTYKYELGVGDHTITISNKDSGCPKVFNLNLKSSELPAIDKIKINEKSVIVLTKTKGKLEYALFDSTGKVIVDWQKNNELIIPDNILDNDFTVKVRLNNCGIKERKNVIYLALPNVVTPNNDGYNDVWQPMIKDGKVNDTLNSYKLIIFDRYGKTILSQEGTNIIKWDGTLNGQAVPDGTYWYLLEFSKQSDDMQVQYSGSILVKRKIK
ncbi:T9SS type B sorting domain-containing protein [Empedobacter brevis]|uniref:T9SS type B sorting domain-containing protein n=1 Tax=Empedobacter brevis TaxID=247 RepID=UPI0039AEDC78